MDANVNPYLTVFQFFPFLLFSACMGVVAYLLARDKGRSVAVWTILGIIPVVNFFCLPYFVGASNLRIEQKLDRLLGQHQGPMGR